MRHVTLPLWFAVLAALPGLVAQDARDNSLRPAGTRLAAALAQGATLPSCRFETSWAPEDARGRPVTTRVEGLWHDDLLSLTFAVSKSQILQRGRRVIARTGNETWRMSRGRFADGGFVAYLPDPPELLALLRQMDPDVLRREVGTLDDRPVETLSVTLSGARAQEAMLSGLLPAGVVWVGVGGGPPALPPLPTLIDLAFHLDPATGFVHRIDGRIHTAGSGMPGVRIVAAGGAVRGVVVEEEEEEERETLEQAAGRVPAAFDKGLPVRKLKDCGTMAFTLTLTDHGKVETPVLDSQAAGLLGK